VAVLVAIASSHYKEVLGAFARAYARMSTFFSAETGHGRNILYLTLLFAAMFAVMAISRGIFKTAHVLWRVHVTGTLRAAPRPPNSSWLEWCVMGHARYLLSIREKGGVQILLREWSESLNGEKYFVIWLGPFEPNIIVADPEGAKNVLTSPKRFVKGFVYDAIRFVVPEGITNAEGARWKYLRRLVTPCFHSTVVEALVPAMSKVAEMHMNSWLEPGQSAIVNVHALISRLTLSVILKTTLGDVVDSKDGITDTYTNFGQMMSYVATMIVSPLRFIVGSGVYIQLPFAEHRAFKDRVEQLESVVTSALQGHGSASTGKTATGMSNNNEGKAEGVGKNLMSVLVSEFNKAAVEHPAGVKAFTEKTLRDQLGTFLAAGHDTTAALLSFCLAAIMRRPEILRRLREEADSVLADGGDMTYAKVVKLEYTMAVLRETLRHDPPGPIIARQATSVTDIVLGHRVAPGTSVWVAIYLLHHDASVWDRPHEFDPDRWLGSSESATKRHAASFIPFSIGSRNCVGRRFALIESALLLCMLVRRFDIGPPGESSPPLVRETAVVNRPKNGLMVKLAPRSHI
jgi:cytochrome P450